MYLGFKGKVRMPLLILLMTAVALGLIYFGRQQDKTVFDNKPIEYKPVDTNISADEKFFVEEMEQIKLHASLKRTEYTVKQFDIIAAEQAEKDAKAQANNSKPVSAAPANSLEAILKSGKPLEQKLRDYLGTKVSKAGIGYYDIQTGKSFSINGDKYYTAASTVKVQMNMVLFDMVKEGKVNINEALQYTSGDYEGGTGILQGKDKSKPIPLLTLSDYSIIYSDNIATNMIMRRIDRTEMKRRFGEKVGHPVPMNSNVVTPNEGLAFLKQLYENKGSNQYYARLIGIMKTTVFHDRLDRYVPKDIVAHKIGNYGSFVNDVGIVYAPKPYVIVVYTDNLPNANEIIANINKIIYEEHK